LAQLVFKSSNIRFEDQNEYFVGKNLANFETVRGYVIRIAKGVTYEALMQEKMQVIDRNLEAELLCESRGRAP
jgi:hypothetical protein